MDLKIRTKPVTFTIYTSKSEPLSKRYTVSLNGTIQKTAAAQFYEGEAMRRSIDFVDFPNELSKATQLNAFGFGIFDESLGSSAKIVVSNQAKPEKGFISRTKEYFKYKQQPGILMFDYDPSDNGYQIKSPEIMMNIFTEISRVFKDVAFCSRGSLSSGVCKAREIPKQGGGFHLYMPVMDASDIPRVGKILLQRLWLAGFGHIDLSANGSMLIRTIIDGVVFSPERMDFVGVPIVDDTLMYLPPAITFRNGGYLDSLAIPDIDTDELTQYVYRVEEAKNLIQSLAESTKKKWTAQKINEMLSRGISDESAITQINSISQGEKIQLPPDFFLYFDGLGSFSISEVLANPQRFDGKTLADPIEGIPYGKTTAKFWSNDFTTGKPFIHSMAHGGVGYYLSQNQSKKADATAEDLKTKIEIKLTDGDLPKIVDQCEEALLLSNGYYQRSGTIVRIIPCDKASNSSETSIKPIDFVHLTEAFMNFANYSKYNAKTKKWGLVDLPYKYANTYLSRQHWKLANLVGVIHAPTLRPDGSILDKPGYDKKSGLYFDPGLTVFLKVPVNPTQADAKAALSILVEPLKEFKFKEESDFSTAIAAILTALIRRSIDNAPLFLITAAKMGSGKGLLVNIISLIATGRNAPVMSHVTDPNEERKRLIALLIEGEPIMCIDNIEKPLASDTLCSVLTMPELKDRLLGKSQMISAPTNALFFATGNNVEVLGDLTRRVLPCHIDPEVERPQESQFSYHLPTYVREHRPKLVQAALIILRAYHVAGRPQVVTPNFGSFEHWSDWIRGALLWLEMSDPYNGLRRIEKADLVRMELANVQSAWYELFGSEVITVSKLIKIAEEETNHLLNDALYDVAGSTIGINSRKLGHWLKKNDGRIESSLRIESMGFSGTRVQYRVSKINSCKI